MTTRYLWTLDRAGRPLPIGFDTMDDLTAFHANEDLPGVMPADWLVMALLMNEDETGAAFLASPHGWTLEAKWSERRASTDQVHSAIL